MQNLFLFPTLMLVLPIKKKNFLNPFDSSNILVWAFNLPTFTSKQISNVLKLVIWIWVYGPIWGVIYLKLSCFVLSGLEHFLHRTIKRKKFRLSQFSKFNFLFKFLKGEKSCIFIIKSNKVSFQKAPTSTQDFFLLGISVCFSTAFQSTVHRPNFLNGVE